MSPRAAANATEEQWMDVAGVGKTIAGRVVRAIRNGHGLGRE